MLRREVSPGPTAAPRSRRIGVRTLTAATVLTAAALLPAPGADAAATRLGIADSSSILRYEGAPSPGRQARLHARTGARLARVTINWNVAQPTAPNGGAVTYDFSRFDPTIRALIRRRIKPIIVLLGTPSWARRGFPFCQAATACPPGDVHLPKFGAFAVAVARRYPGLHAIEIWNEPNRNGAWRSSGGPDAAQYAEMLNVAGGALRDLDPRIRLLIGSLGYIQGGVSNPPGLTIGSFLRDLYKVLDPALLTGRTGLGLHAYPGRNELKGLRPLGRFRRTLAEARAALASDDPGRLLWITETGVSTTSRNPRGRPVNEVEQARTIDRALTVLTAAPDVRAALAYTLVDRPPDDAAPDEEGFGLLRRGPRLETKRAYCKLAGRSARTPRGC